MGRHDPGRGRSRFSLDANRIASQRDLARLCIPAISICEHALGKVQADGREIMTIEGMEGESLHPLQEGFYEEHGLQCGFCTPGMIMSAKHLLDNNPKPNEEEIRCGISGNLCRCTGYQNIVKS